MPMSETKTSKKHVILTSWASVATALLIMVLIGGAFYTADLKSRECTTTQSSTSDHETKAYSRTYNNGDDKTKEDFYVDKDDQTELIIKKNEDGNIELIAATDFRTKITAAYVPEGDQCLLLAGEDMDWVDQWGQDEEQDSEVTVTEDTLQKETFKVSGNQVTDTSIIPDVMKPYCKGKPTYWLQPADDADLEASRQKRAACYRYVCYYLFTYNGRNYYRCYYWKVSMDYC